VSEWTQEELDILGEEYPKHGPSWDGWPNVLPNRSICSIKYKVAQLGICVLRKGNKHRRVACMPGRPPMTQDPYEPYVLRRMEEGLSPSQIDMEMKWRPGKTVLVLTERWERMGYTGADADD